MRRFLFFACAVVMLAGIAATGASADGQAQTVTVEVCPTSIEYAGAQRIFTTPSGIQHFRKVPIDNSMRLGTSCDAPAFGSVFYSLNANVWPDGTSTASCTFSMETPYGDFQGECNGSLATGHLIGHGGGGSTLEGVYQVIDPAAFEYRLTIHFESR